MVRRFATLVHNKPGLLDIPPIDFSALARLLLPYVLTAMLFAGAVASAWWFQLPNLLTQAFLAQTAQWGLQTKAIDIWGLRYAQRFEIEAVLQVSRGAPLLALDLPAIREKLETLAWVEQASVMRQFPDRLVVRIGERTPFALWQHAGRLALIDRQGRVLTQEQLERFPNLPLVVGAGAPARAQRLFVKLDGLPRLKAQLDSVVWVGARRWDIRFKSGEVLLLPEGATQSEAALQAFAALEAANPLLGKGFTRFDMRLPDRMFLRKSVQQQAPAGATKAGITSSRTGAL
jgi:cell division protein FtsQ